MHLCKCGCGLEVKEGNRFIHGHNSRGRPVLDETRKKIGDAQTGEKNHNFGKHCTEEHKKLLREIALNNGNCPPPSWGRPVSNETREKIGDAQRGEKNHRFGKVTSYETKKKISESKMGVGKSAETRLKMSIASKGDKNNSWKGGISFEPYCPKFDSELKQRIRDHYNNCDFFSGLPDHICNVINGVVRKLAVHHIDYNKMQGCDDIKFGLIPLSHSNHTKTNFNRSFWERLICYALDYDETYYNLDGGV